LRMSRNKKTGASKHYAFVEFALADVAKIVAETMNNYLIFGHLLQCKLVPSEKLHPEMFKGANRKFAKVPTRKIAVKRYNEAQKKHREFVSVPGLDYDASAVPSSL